MTAEVQAIGEWKTNAEMMVDVAQLGYLPEPVLDMTYGRGNFWTIYEPTAFCRNDLNPSRGVSHENFTATNFGTGQFETAVFDPPYKLAGTPDSADMDDAYGTDEVRSRPELLALLVGGMAEATRIARTFVLVKTQDMVSSGAVRWQTHIAVDVARALDFRLHDSLLFRSGRPQPAGRKQLHARRAYSTLLVFKRKAY